jgi:hypothetical protein
MAGGAPISIQGSNMASMPNMNEIVFVSSNIAGV